jgi:EmrB/QacA subfamily drug resistance transporter
MTEAVQPAGTDHSSIGTGTRGDPTQLTWRLRAILAVVLIADILDLMDSTITTIAAPSIVRDIGGGQSLIKWLGASYALAIGVLLVIGGRLGDRYGKRRLFLVGITGFTAASALCGLSVDPTMIIIGRLIQGSFGALLIPQGISILMASFSRDQLPRAISAFGPVMGVSAVMGPIVAGFIITANLAGLNWRPVFLINIVLGIIGLIAAVKLLPRDKSISHEHIDVYGSGLLGAAMLTLIFGLIQGSTNGWTTFPIFSLIAGTTLFVAFTIRQRLASNPLIQPSLLANKGFTAGLLVGLGFFASVSGLSYVISLFFQLILHLTPSQAAIGLSPMAIGIIGAAIVCRPQLQTLGRRLVTIGLSITLVGAIGLWATVVAKGLTVSPWLTAPSILILGFGMGACFSSIYEVALVNVEHHEGGSASGALSAVQQLATAIGSAVVTTIYFSLERTQGGARGLTVSLVVVIVMTFLCLGLVRFMPKSAPPDEAIAEQ